MAPKSRRATEEEIRRRWTALEVERRRDVLCFDDPVLVERIKSALQDLFDKQMMMQRLGISLTDVPDPFAASSLFTSAFEFTWQIGRSVKNPKLMLIDPMGMPVMAVKPLLLEGERLFEDLRPALPDFLSERSGRWPLPRARWKDLWAVEPASISAVEQQLVKLVEQALWAMGADPAFEVHLEEKRPQPLTESLEADSVLFESWMISDEGLTPKSCKGSELSGKRRKRKKVRAPGSVANVVVESPAAEEEHELPQEPCEDGQGDADGEEHCAQIIDDGELTSQISPDQADQPPSDDESVGIGTFHMTTEEVPGSSTGVTTAASTPAPDVRIEGKGRRRSKRIPETPPSTPVTRGMAMHPPQLVCYIWNQTSQFSNGVDGQVTPGWQRASASRCSTNPTTPHLTPFARGAWRGSPSQAISSTPSSVISAVVKNTFLDIDDPNEPSQHGASCRNSRSLSPSLLLPRFYDHDHDHWHL